MERSSEYPFLPLHWFCNSQYKKQLRAAFAEVHFLLLSLALVPHRGNTHSIPRVCCTQEGFFRDLPPRDGALAALHSMLAFGLDVRIVISSTAGKSALPVSCVLDDSCLIGSTARCVLGSIGAVSDQMKWVESKLGRNWTDRVIVSKVSSQPTCWCIAEHDLTLWSTPHH
jgi:hypothetical protein